MHDETVLLTRDGAVAWLRLNRPGAMNALDAATLHSLDRHLTRLGAEPATRVVVLTGTGRAFCAGADLKAVADSGGGVQPDTVIDFVRHIGRVVTKLATFPKPVIAAVNGLALAGGLELLLACDLVVASDQARIGDAHANYALLPGAGGSARLPRLVGPRLAKQLLFTGASVPAADLVARGLVNEVVPADELQRRTTELARTIAEKSPLTLAHMKRLVADGLDQPLAGALRMELDTIEAYVASDDIREGLAAFRDKRTPVYQGR
jgi:enoyl-CoA hydratase/carnithine racemase